jgi:putative transposon-encoded protein
MTEVMEIHTRAFQAIDRIVRNIGNSGGIYLPKEWVGRKVKVLLVEDEKEK